MTAGAALAGAPPAGTGAPFRAVCPLERVPLGRGVCVLVDGEQVALFRPEGDQLFAVGNLDPFSGAMVMSRGIVGSRAGRTTVASPMYKQVFDLTTGECLDDASKRLARHESRVRDGWVEIQLSTGT